MLDMGLFKLHDSLTLSHVPPTAEGFSKSFQLPFFVPSLWCSTEKAKGVPIFPKHCKSYGELALSMTWWYLRQWFSTYWLNSENTSYMRTGVTFSSFRECSQRISAEVAESKERPKAKRNSPDKGSQNSVHLISLHTDSFRSYKWIRWDLPLPGFTTRVCTAVTKEMNGPAWWIKPQDKSYWRDTPIPRCWAFRQTEITESSSHGLCDLGNFRKIPSEPW